MFPLPFHRPLWYAKEKKEVVWMANTIILTVLGGLFVLLSLLCAAEWLRRRRSQAKEVHLPAVLLVVGLIGGAVFWLFGYFAARDDGSLWLTICFGTFQLLGLSLLTAWKNCYLTYDKSGFTAKSFFGRRRSYTYAQVTGWYNNPTNPTESVLQAEGRKISFNLLHKNGADFLVTLAAGYRKTHGGRNMPDLRDAQRAKGGFAAHVYNPGEYLFIFLMLLAFIVGTGAFLIFDSLRPVEKDPDLEAYTLTFTDYAIDDTTLVLTSPQMPEPFHVLEYATYLHNFDRLQTRCDGETTFSVWVTQVTDPDDPHYYIWSLSSTGVDYYTFEDANAYNRGSVPMILCLFGGFLAVLLLFSGLIYAVGSNPAKFPRWLVYSCFKKDAIEF